MSHFSTKSISFLTIISTAKRLYFQYFSPQFSKFQAPLQQFQSLMKKQFFYNISTQFPNELNCSSIRINAEQQENAVPKRKEDKKGIQLNSGPKLKKYEQNDIVGFQMSLEIEDNRQNCLQLMRSKSARDLLHSKQQKQKLQHSKKQKQQNVCYGGSLYNTTSFDEMTMNITTNTRINNITNTQINTDSLEYDKNAQKTLKKHHELTSFKETRADNQLTIKFNRQQPQIKIVDQQQKKIPSALLQALKCSITEEEKLQKQSQQPSYDEPYFKIGSMGRFDSATKLEQTNKLFINDHRRDIKKMTSVDTSKSNQKKLTLRDYMYLSKLTGKKIEKGSSYHQAPQSPHFARSTVNTSRSKKKLICSNSEVMQQLKRQVIKNIELVQGNMNLLLQFIQTSQIDEEVSQKQMMKMYNLARILKDKIVNGNDQLVIMLQQANRE